MSTNARAAGPPAPGLSRRHLGTGPMWIFAVGASSPMTVLVAAVPQLYAATGVLGVPLAFLILGAVLALLSVGYVAMSRHVPAAGAGYVLLTHGLGRSAGVAGAAVALLGYNAIQISLYGFLGYTLHSVAGGPWWLWALLAWAAVAGLGVRHVRVSAGVLGVALAAELVVLGLLNVAAFTHPGGGHISLAALHPGALFTNGVGGAFAFGIASFLGYEFPPAYGEEARDHRAVARATFYALGFLALFYAATSWALAVAVGPGGQIIDATRNPSSAGVPLDVLTHWGGPGLGLAGLLLLITSVLGAMLAFHNTVARYAFALGRERLLPGVFAHTSAGPRGGAPAGGSVAQSVVALVFIIGFAYLGLDPVLAMFTWLSTVGALAILVLLLGCAAAALRYFRSGGQAEPLWVRTIAPGLGLLTGAAVLGVVVDNMASLLGVTPGAALTYIVPGVVAATVAAGLVWAGLVATLAPGVYHHLGANQPHELANREPRLDMPA